MLFSTPPQIKATIIQLLLWLHLRRCYLTLRLYYQAKKHQVVHVSVFPRFHNDKSKCLARTIPAQAYGACGPKFLPFPAYNLSSPQMKCVWKEVAEIGVVSDECRELVQLACFVNLWWERSYYEAEYVTCKSKQPMLTVMSALFNWSLIR